MLLSVQELEDTKLFVNVKVDLGRDDGAREI